MKHLLVINTHAGHGKDALEAAKKSFEGLDYEIYETERPRKVVDYLKSYLTKNKKETVRVYACGGDGTLHEVVNGLVGFKNAELALYACGTGNDFAKIYGGTKRFLDFNKLANAKTVEIDLTKLEGDKLNEPWYSINVINFGFDAIVGVKGNENKIKGKKNPYGFTQAIVPAILHGRFNDIEVVADGENLNGKKLTLGSVSQGQWVGGEYHASPKSDNTDGLLDVVAIKTMTFVRLMAQLFGAYHDGKHLDNKKLESKVKYKQAKEVVIRSLTNKTIDMCVDGEIVSGNEFKCSICPKAIKFVLPEE